MTEGRLYVDLDEDFSRALYKSTSRHAGGFPVHRDTDLLIGLPQSHGRTSSAAGAETVVSSVYMPFMFSYSNL